MNLETIKEKLQSSEYDFLRSNEHLGNNIMLLTLGGSHAYGTDVETSDLDVRGIAIERPQEMIGLSTFQQFDNSTTDTVIYSFRKIVSLMLECNPNTIEIMGTLPEQIFTMTAEGKLLRDNYNLFLSRKAAHSFGGYANQQLRRLQNALARDSYPQAEKEKHILGSIESQMNTLSTKYAEITGEQIKLYLDKSDKEDFDIEIFVDINLKHYPLRDFKNVYSEIGNTIKEYGKLNHRNNKKDDLHLHKHQMHLIRLKMMGSEILEGKGINTYRKNERDFLLKIRNGEFTNEEVYEMNEELEKRFQYAKANSPLPEKPNYKEVEDLVMAINSMILGIK